MKVLKYSVLVLLVFSLSASADPRQNRRVSAQIEQMGETLRRDIKDAVSAILKGQFAVLNRQLAIQNQNSAVFTRRMAHRLEQSISSQIEQLSDRMDQQFELLDQKIQRMAIRSAAQRGN